MSNAPFLTPGSLSQAIDEHIFWLSDWNRLALLDLKDRAIRSKTLSPGTSFSLWYKSALHSLPQDQPSVDRLAVLHDQLHTLARLVLMRTPDGAQVERKDYEAVVAKFGEFLQGLRRLERAFSVAASGLDLLTGLRSRVGLKEDLIREHSRFLRNGKTFCVAMMDIDHFKSVNDTHGHDVGDIVLAAVADHVSRCVRPFDDTYRMGGEEFLICLKEADLADGLKVIDRLRSSLETLSINFGAGKLQTTASFGITVCADEVTIEDLIHRADQALYRAKNQGRNRIVVLAPNAD